MIDIKIKEKIVPNQKLCFKDNNHICTVCGCSWSVFSELCTKCGEHWNADSNGCMKEDNNCNCEDCK